MNFVFPSDWEISKGQRDGLTTRSLSLATLAKLAECSPDAMAVIDRHGEIVWVNAQTEKMFGYTRDDLLGQSVGSLVPDRSREILLTHHWTYSAEPGVPRLDNGLELNGRRKDGTEFPIEIMLSPIETDEEPALVLAAVHDLSNRKGAEDALHESEEQFRMILDHSPNLIFLKDVEGRYLFVNKEFQRVFHISQEQIKGKKDEEVFLTDQAAAFRTNDLRVLRIGISMEFEEVALHDDGPHASIVHKFPLRNPEGKIYAIGGIAIDITKRKRAQAKSLALQKELATELTERKGTEDRLQKAQTELAHASRVTMMGELASSIAHELNQPLGAIVNNCNVCRRLTTAVPGSRSELQEVLSDIINDANRASAIVARVRSLIKKTTPDRTLLQVKSVIGDVLALAHREFAARRITVHTELAEDLPCVSGDRVQLQQVLLNLVMNGIDAMSEVADGRHILTIGAQRSQLNGRPAVLITVHDLGDGFKTEDNERLFEAFYSTKPHGLGMGLRIGRSIVEAHGGRLWATPNDGPGATFSCALPAEAA